MKNIVYLYIVALFVACGDSSKTAVNSTLADGHYDYQFVQSKDSSFMSIDVKGADIKGSYTFIPEVSDGAVGEITGTQANGKINGNLTFTIEGSTQTEQIIIEIKGADLIWNRYQLNEDPTTQVMIPDTSKIVDTQKFVLKGN
jgi:hypothetical protein